MTTLAHSAELSTSYPQDPDRVWITFLRGLEMERRQVAANARSVYAHPALLPITPEQGRQNAAALVAAWYADDDQEGAA